MSRNRTLTAFRSNGLGSRTVRQPPHHPWLHTRNLYSHSMAAYPLCQNHGPTPTRRCNSAHPFRLRRFPWSSSHIRLSGYYASPLQKTFSRLLPRRLRSSLPPNKTHSLPRLAFDHHRCPRPRPRRYPSPGSGSPDLHPRSLEIRLLSRSLRLRPTSDGESKRPLGEKGRSCGCTVEN